MSQNQNEAAEQAAIELFAKQASAEGIDLESLSDEQVEAAFGHFVENILPELLADDAKTAGTDEAAEAAEGADDSVEAKIAAAQNALAFDAFCKAAAAEDVDLNELSEDDVAELFGAWLVQDVPTLFEEQAKEAELIEYAKIAEANLSEMTVMGQHLGEVAADAFLAKVAATSFESASPAMRGYARARASGAGMAESAKRAVTGQLKSMPAARSAGAAVKKHVANLGEAVLDARTAPVGQRLGAAARLGKAAAPSAGLAAGTAALGYGAYKGIKALSGKSEAAKSASAIDERVLEILAAHGLIEG